MRAAHSACQTSTITRQGSSVTRRSSRRAALVSALVGSALGGAASSCVLGGKAARRGDLSRDLREQEFGAYPRMDRIGSEIREPVQARDRFVPLDVQLNLPPQRIQLHHTVDRKNIGRDSREDGDKARGTQGLRSHFGALLFAEPGACFPSFVGRKPYDAEPAFDPLTIVIDSN